MKTPRIKIYLKIKFLIKSFFTNYKKSQRNIENAIKLKLNKRYIYLTGMCRTGFIIVLDYLKDKSPNKNEIIMCSYNLQEMVDIARLKNFNLKLLDVNMENCIMDIENIKKNVNSRTAAIVYTNMFNDSKILSNIKNLCNEKEILFIEDNAIYFGNYTEENNIKTYSGSFGHVSLLSFGIMKNVSALFGGACLTSDEELAKYISGKIDGFSKFPNALYFKQIFLFLILKSCLSKIIYNLVFFNIIRLAELKNLPLLQKLFYPALKFEKKLKIPDYYTSRISKLSISMVEQLLDDSSVIKNDEKRKDNNKLYFDLLNKEKNINIIPIKDFNFQNFLDFPIIVKNKKKLINYLYNYGLEVRTHFYSNCENLIELQNNKNSQYLDGNIICLPSHHDIDSNKIKEYCFRIEKFYKL